MVAKSYQKLTFVDEPYAEKNGKMYQKVLNENTGKIYKVRWYTEDEYYKMYPEDKPANPFGEQRKLLGFDEGYITIFKGYTDEHDDWFNRSIALYCVHWGWYIVSTDEIPTDIPSCIQPVKLFWEKVGNADGTLLPKSTIDKAVQELLFNDHPSQYQGEIGDRIERKVVLTAAIELGETQFGSQRLYCFEDKEKNQYAWKTGVSKDWEIGNEVSLKGTVKEHEIYKGVKRTVLTRVMEGK